MKKTITLIIFLITTFGYSQELKPLKIFHSIDDMTKKEYYFPSRRLVYADTITKSGDLKIEGFGVNFTFGLKKNEVNINGLQIKCSSIGCLEKTKILFLFDNSETLELSSFSSFDCDGDAFFFLSKKHIEKLALSKVKKIRITNGRNYQSVTGEIDENDYFINSIALLQNKDFTEKNN